MPESENLYPSSNISGFEYFLRSVIKQRRSQSSVTLPPQLMCPFTQSMASHGISSCSSRKVFSMVMDVSRSESLKSQRMFQPSGPNFLRSYRMAWKKDRPKTSFFQASDFLQSFRTLSVKPWQVRLRFALRPRGGSVVSLTPFWRTDTGK